MTGRGTPSRSPVKAVVFDFDGVLVESTEIKTEAFRALFHDRPEALDAIIRYHLEHQGVSRYEKFRHIYRDILKRPLSPGEEVALGERFQALVIEQVVGASWVPGAPACLESCSGRFPLYVASGTPQEELERIIDRRGMRRYFAGVYGSPSSKPDILRRIISRFGADPSAIVFVGDSKTDHEAARTAGVRFVLRVKSPPEGTPLADGTPAIETLTEFVAYLESLEAVPGVPLR